MWWLAIPVILYTAGLLTLWFILVRHNSEAPPAGAGSHLVELPAGEDLPGAGTPAAGHFTAGQPGAGAHKSVPAGAAIPEPGVVASGAVRTLLPKVTVVVATRNEEKNITTLLESLASQDYPDDLLEIIIVNDNSTDRTPVIVSEFISGRAASVGTSPWLPGSERTAAGLPCYGGIVTGMPASDRTSPRMRLIYNPYTGKKRAVRYGIQKASGAVILTTDADCTVGPEWVGSHASWYHEGAPGQSGIGATRIAAGNNEKNPSPDNSTETGSADMVLAPVVQRSAGGFWSLFGAFEFSALQAITEATAVAGHPVMCNAANMSFRKDVYLRNAGALRQELESGDDMFLLQAVMRDGGVVRHDGRSTAAAVTAGAVTAAALLRQRARWASKTFRYRDAATLSLAAATAACNAAVAAAAVAAFMSVKYLPLAAALYAVKTIPDYLLIAGELRKRGNRLKALPFIASEIIYPFWFMTVGIASLMPGSGRFARR